MNKYFLHGKLSAKAGKGDELSAILLEASGLVATATGCLLYMVSTDPNDADTVWVTELWETAQDHDDSLKVPGVSELIGKAVPILSSMPDKGQELQVLGGVLPH